MKDIKSLYIHYPFCRHLCNYCDFYKHKLKSKQQISQFEILLKEQFDLHKKLLRQNDLKLSKLETIYIGGGTPSLWAKRGSSFLKEYLFSEIDLETDYEFTLEVDPGTWTVEELKMWKEIGVNRFSIGIQSFDEHFTKLLDREHSMNEAYKTLEYFKKHEDNFSVDLMLGLPISEKKRDIIQEIDKLRNYKPNHFSVYILKCRKNYPHYDLLPSDDDVAQEYLNVCEYLNSLGYQQYEVSNFALKDFESKHNLKYWRYDSVAAVGPNASGLLVLDDKNALRYQWKSSSAAYREERLKDTALIIEKLYMQMRAKNCLSLHWLSEENQKAFKSLWKKWQKQGFASVRSKHFELTSNGYLLLDSLMNDIFNTLSI